MVISAGSLMFMPHAEHMCKLVNNYPKLNQLNKWNENSRLATYLIWGKTLTYLFLEVTIEYWMPWWKHVPGKALTGDFLTPVDCVFVVSWFHEWPWAIYHYLMNHWSNCIFVVVITSILLEITLLWNSFQHNNHAEIMLCKSVFSEKVTLRKLLLFRPLNHAACMLTYNLLICWGGDTRPGLSRCIHFITLKFVQDNMANFQIIKT